MAARELTNQAQKSYAHIGADELQSGDEAEESRSSRASKRLAALVVAAVALVAVFACAVMYRSTLPTVKEPDGFMVKFSTIGFAPVPVVIKPKPGLCNMGIVLDFCLSVNGQTPGAYGGDPNSPKAKVTSATLSSLLKVSMESTTGFLTSIGASNITAVGCQELCEKTVGHMMREKVPEMSDVGCYYKAAVRNFGSPCIMPTCDVDVSLPVLAKAAPGYVMNGWQGAAPPTTDKSVSVSVEQMKLSVARLFRVNPTSTTFSFEIQAVTRQRQLKSAPSPDDSCMYSADDMCDEPKYCAAGTDCTDCGSCGDDVPVSPARPQPSPAQYHDVVMQSVAKAQAYLSRAVMGIACCGEGSSAPTESLKQVISDTSLALDSAKYVFPGNKCSITSTYMANGVMNLCQSFFDGADDPFVTILKTALPNSAAFDMISTFAKKNL